MNLGRGRAPNYRTRQEYQGLPQGAFVRPVSFCYLPDFLKQELGPYFNSDEYAPCFTQMGFMQIPHEILEPT